jgi:hypothetical protein
LTRRPRAASPRRRARSRHRQGRRAGWGATAPRSSSSEGRSRETRRLPTTSPTAPVSLAHDRLHERGRAAGRPLSSSPTQLRRW